MKIVYGTFNNSIDVTDICFSKLLYNNTIIIPSSDFTRQCYFTDPLYGVLKKVIIINGTNIKEYSDKCNIYINIIDNTITTVDIQQYDNQYIFNKLQYIQSKLQFKDKEGFMCEIPEQLMVVRYLKGNEKVLEIGSHTGRNSLIIAYILQSNNFVTFECDTGIINQLKDNRDSNNFKFHIENAALSKRKLIQKDFDTIPSDTLQDGYKWVNTVTLDEIKAKYDITFDTLVLDCEGAFYYILMDMPEILENINLIIVENDYLNIEHKKYVDSVLKKNNFYVEYAASGGSGPCYNYFYEVWKRI